MAYFMRSFLFLSFWIFLMKSTCRPPPHVLNMAFLFWPVAWTSHKQFFYGHRYATKCPLDVCLTKLIEQPRVIWLASLYWKLKMWPVGNSGMFINLKSWRTPTVVVISRYFYSLVYELSDYRWLYILSVRASAMTLTAGKSVRKGRPAPSNFRSCFTSGVKRHRHCHIESPTRV